MKIPDSSKLYFTSDTHFGHANIIKYDQRPFADIEEHDEELIRRWNEKVPEDGVVFHLGDFVFKGGKTGADYVKRLNGTIHLILGNHDPDSAEYLKSFASTRDYRKIRVVDSDAHSDRQEIILCHYAFRVWDKCHHGSWHLYGHSHQSLPDAGNKSFDVGVNGWDYAPISYDEVKARMGDRAIIPLDHHAGAVETGVKTMSDEAIKADLERMGDGAW